MKILYNKRTVKIAELAGEFQVSERTIRRDIEILSLSEPIYTKGGRYGGGIYVMDGYWMETNYFDERQAGVLKRITELAKDGQTITLERKEVELLEEILKEYTKKTRNQRTGVREK